MLELAVGDPLLPRYRAHLNGRTRTGALLLAGARAFPSGITIEEAELGIRPPQSWRYIVDVDFDRVIALVNEAD